MDFDELLEDIQIEIEMDWIALDWWKTVNRIVLVYQMTE